MFTGIVTDVGTVVSLEDRGDLRARIRCGYAPDGIALGASIACDGICLTVVDRGPDGAGAWFDVDLSAETVARTDVRRTAAAGPRAPGSTSSGRCGSATNSAATSSPAMSTASPRSSTSAPRATASASASRCPTGSPASSRRRARWRSTAPR